MADPTVVHADAADGTFSATGATNWDKNHTITGLLNADSPTFAGLTLSGLTASRLVATDSSKALTSTVSGLSPTFTGLTLSGLTQYRLVLVGASGVLSDSANLTFGAATGQGLVMAAGTATTDVAALSITRTNNDSSITKGVEIIFTDGTSAAGFLPINVLGGAAGATTLFKVDKSGNGTLGGNLTITGGFSTITGGASIFIDSNGSGSINLRPNGGYGLGVSNAGAVYLNPFGIGASTFMDNVPPTIASGFGTNPSIVASNGTAAFTVNVGTGGTATGGVLTMPAAKNGWAAKVENITAVAANRGDQRTVITATTTTSITVQNQTISTGAALAWTASDVLQIMCLGY